MLANALDFCVCVLQSYSPFGIGSGDKLILSSANSKVG